ncbi:MAG: GIY-YIG nuclease family protein [Phycisphaeraceae bacterium]|nr:GIY-YIG nuclease family protein [Phycisphaeraceae bacterium]MCW5763443.1 GIY-YIG nuclease family protein [Phycisphaeraceae bacterium]
MRHDNVGTLEAEIRDAFTIVNFGGKPFRDARITEAYLASRLEELRWAVIAFELRQREQEEQRQIRERIREEEKARREYEKAIRQAAKEEEALRKAMAEAEARIAAATSEQRAAFEAQLAELAGRLAEAEEKNQRALSMAQQTRRGHVYIISNVGSFGEDVYKIGLTRRLDPLDRVRELGDASVPFEFDVHAVIFSEDAPALETRLHKHFLLNQINKVNHRKEFFRAPLTDIRREIDVLGVEAKWTMLAEARQYRESLAIEERIAADPAAREAWLNRQLILESESEGDAVELLEEV